MKIKDVTSSIPILAGLSVLFIGVTVAIIVPGSAFIINESASIVTNFYITAGVMLMLIFASIAIGFFTIRLIWGPATEVKQGPIIDETAEEDAELDELTEMRGMRVTGTKKIAVLITVLALNAALFDWVGNGVLISDTRAIKVMTLLRSEAGQDRADAVTDAIILVGDERIAHALKAVIEAPGTAPKEWAAYAAGMRHDTKSADALVSLMTSGNEREQVAAATALARLGDERLIRHAEEVYQHANTLKGDIVKAMGMLGHREHITKGALEKAGSFLAGRLEDAEIRKDEKMRQLVVWAAGRFRAPECLLAVEKLLESGVDNATMCIGLEAVGRIGSASSSPKLVEAIRKFDKSLTCPEMVYADYTGHEVLLCERINIIERLLHEIARIGDRRARPAMVALSKDSTFSPAVQSLAAEIAFQMKYKTVEKPSQ
jgi:HEAT repeat protein